RNRTRAMRSKKVARALQFATLDDKLFRCHGALSSSSIVLTLLLSTLCLIPFLHLRDNVIHFLRGQFGVHRQADATPGVVLSVRQRAEDERVFSPRLPRLLTRCDHVF